LHHCAREQRHTKECIQSYPRTDSLSELYARLPKTTTRLHPSLPTTLCRVSLLFCDTHSTPSFLV
jgi:hypothetical protein